LALGGIVKKCLYQLKTISHVIICFAVRHRQKEKEYRQKLAELRKKEKTKISDEESLWKVLDESQLQEELEEELDR
jgi:hypothetical protein